MPELPEVETVCRGLRASMVGRRMENIQIRRAMIRLPVPPDLPKRIAGAYVKAVERRAKYILITMDNGYCLLVHLGMSGRMMVFSTAPQELHKHDHVLFKLDDGQTVIFNDPRRFGLVIGAPCTEIAAHPLLAGLGPEPLSEAFNAEYLFHKLQKRKQHIKPALMDQKLVVGVGNIYASEALFKSGINPERPANEIDKEKYQQLVTAIHSVLNAAIASGGSTLRNYVNSGGQSGYFQHHFDVYGRESKPCSKCGGLVARITQAGRSTFYCGHCQK